MGIQRPIPFLLAGSDDGTASTQVGLCLLLRHWYSESGPDSAFSSVDLPAYSAVVSSNCIHMQKAWKMQPNKTKGAPAPFGPRTSILCPLLTVRSMPEQESHVTQGTRDSRPSHSAQVASPSQQVTCEERLPSVCSAAPSDRSALCSSHLDVLSSTSITDLHSGRSHGRGILQL